MVLICVMMVGFDMIAMMDMMVMPVVMGMAAMTVAMVMVVFVGGMGMMAMGDDDVHHDDGRRLWCWFSQGRRPTKPRARYKTSDLRGAQRL